MKSRERGCPSPSGRIDWTMTEKFPACFMSSLTALGELEQNLMATSLPAREMLPWFGASPAGRGSPQPLLESLGGAERAKPKPWFMLGSPIPPESDAKPQACRIKGLRENTTSPHPAGHSEAAIVSCIRGNEDAECFFGQEGVRACNSLPCETKGQKIRALLSF